MHIVFDAGKLTGDAMNQCFLLIQQASSVFANDEVSPSYYYIPLGSSLHISDCNMLHYRTVLVTYSERVMTRGILCAR